jgi:hypothetical protein
MSDSDGNDGRTVDRRTFLKGAGVVGTAAGIVGLGWYTANRFDDGPGRATPTATPARPSPGDTTGPPPTGATETDGRTPTGHEHTPGGIPHAEEFGTVVEAAAGGFPPGTADPVNPLFEDNGDDGTLFAFEPGTYRIDTLRIANVDRIGVVSVGENPVRFVPSPGPCVGNNPYVFFDTVRDLLLEGVTFDLRGVDSGGPLFLYLRGDSTVRDVTYLGNCSNQRAFTRIEVRDEQGSALVDRLVARNVQGNNNLTGVYVGDNHAGELTFRDCELEAFADNGIYASPPGGAGGEDGPVHVVGGTYRNNNVASVRLGSTGSTAEGVSVVVDQETPGWGQLNARGIRLRNRAGQVVRDCDITYAKDAADSFGAVVFHPANGGGVVRDTDIQIDRGGIPAVRAFPPEQGTGRQITLEGLTVTGDAHDGVTARIEGRDGTTVRNCTIEQPGRSGLFVRDAQDCRVEDSNIVVEQDPVVLENAAMTLRKSTVVSGGEEVFYEELELENESLTL